METPPIRLVDRDDAGAARHAQADVVNGMTAPGGTGLMRLTRPTRLALFARIAMASLVALIAISVSFAFVAARGTSPGYVLALAKCAALGFVWKRVRDRELYTMQWSSMFILLFVAEGTVRAMSDPRSSAVLGAIEALVATTYFAVVLAYLGPLKKAAARARRERSTSED